MRVLLLLCLSVFSTLSLADENDPLYTEIHGNGIYTTAQKSDGEKRAEKIARDLERGGLFRLAQRTTTALRGIYQIGISNLRRKGYRAEADQLQRDWDTVVSTEIMRVLNKKNRDIGDWEPLSIKLALAYELLEYKLGYQICFALRLTDLKSLNYGIPVVFQPCEYGLSEFHKHFVHDDRYRGVAPLVSYWTTVISCSIMTAGAGYFFICSPLGMAVELGMDKVVAPWLAPKIYNLACDFDGEYKWETYAELAN